MAEGSPESDLLCHDFARLHDLREQGLTETEAHRAREDFREEGIGKRRDRTGNNKNLFSRMCQELQEMNRKAAKRAGEIRVTFQSTFSSLIA